ncbi:uncharacterized protein LOC134249533, partial [Saccostrea cucullata]|uniref:uncharacterized protein LOC134249533 n=1 Tax=Saccostrea cuccullata TaxID=36930 RepID=UPI002ED23AB6
MSLSKCYISTPETTNTARLARLILGPCTDVLRDVLKTEVKPSDLSRKVKEFTDKLPRGQRNPLNKIQSEIIFPKATNQYSGDYSDLDISLLYLLLRNVSKIAPHSKGWGEIPNPADRSVAANIERIRLIRNQYYGHSADPSLSGSEFRQEWRNIRDIVVELERHLGATTVYQDAVTTIKTCSMDPEQEKKYIDLLGDIRELHTTVNNISNKMQIIQDSALQYDPKVARKIEITQKMLIKHNENMTPFFVKTRAYNKAKELLEAKRYIIIKGNPGTGKTTIAKMLMKELMEEGKSALQLQKFTDLYESVSPGDGTVVLIDNVFGEFSFSSGDIKDLSATAELVTILIENVTDCKSNNLIFTIRNDIYNEYVGMVHNDTFFVSSMVDISDKTYALQEAEILQLADKYDLKNTIEKQDLLRKVHEMPIWIGFPQCCKLAKSNAVIKQKISDFLLDPKMFLREYFKILIKTQTSKSAVLAYLLLS